MITNPSDFFASGCGRCSKFDTSDCKVQRWRSELAQLRSILLDCGLTEEAKWGHPVYTFQKSNVVMLGAFNEDCMLSFFKGSLLHDEAGILVFAGENSQVAKIVRFTDLATILRLEDTLKAYIFEAIEVEKAGVKPSLKKIEEYTVPEEFQQKLDENPDLQVAFRALTPGRQRGYLIHFSQPKQAKTRVARIEKCLPLIFAGRGLMD
ncbi:MAG: YdeI/OmpD-associated family protein [Haliscomenobacter sp.]|uniref:YdeI/OmpD-associated family protein n=1 Tax=Haliscomenobacter sp. TaxID=2717303 RepID=UPI0029A978F2|nr:YdeI/OmpD-associated family protein [Haliscomenobacter sp.]MDX2069557.1 YdeI/OmpD-associated family protein [Haliscomenobacter sp.]